jgi:hypothetical protein
VALCIAAENVAKLFLARKLFVRSRATTGFGRCERGDLRFGVLVVPLLNLKFAPLKEGGYIKERGAIARASGKITIEMRL